MEALNTPYHDCSVDTTNLLQLYAAERLRSGERVYKDFDAILTQAIPVRTTQQHERLTPQLMEVTTKQEYAQCLFETIIRDAVRPFGLEVINNHALRRSLRRLLTIRQLCSFLRIFWQCIKSTICE